MKFGLSEKELSVVIAVFKKFPEIEEVVLFGSRALNTFKSSSDVDIALKGQITFDTLSQVKGLLEEKTSLPYKFDVISYVTIENVALKQHIDDFGKSIYSADRDKSNKWGRTTLSEVASVNDVSIDKNYSFDEIEYIDIASVDKGRVLELKRMLRKEAPSRAQRVVRNNDIILSTVRPNLKHFAFIRKAKPNTIASTGFAVITSKKIDPRFLYYYLTTDNYTDFLSAIADAHTSTYPAFNPDILKNSEIPLPPEKEQRAIGKVLSDLDEKIEINHQMNKTLESIAEALFNRWFVDFEFPGYEKVKFINGLPEGWRKGKISECCAEIKNGGTPRRDQEHFWNGGNIPWLTSGEVRQSIITSTDNFITDEGMKKSSAKWVDPFSTVVALYGATAGQVSLVSTKLTTNQAVCSLIPKKNFSFFNYSWMRSVVGELENKAVGSAQQNISKAIVEETPVVIPSILMLEQFGSVVRSIFLKRILNIDESKRLAEMRDSLLPRLMSGKIRETYEY